MKRRFIDEAFFVLFCDAIIKGVDFNIKGDGGFVGSAGNDHELTADGNGYIMIDKALTNYYFAE